MRWYNVVFFILCIASSVCIGTHMTYAASSPHIANYYLGELHGTKSFIERMASYDLLILTPEQIAQKHIVVSEIKKQNPDILIFAYLPSQSYNEQYWPQSPVFRNLHVQDDWWLRDSGGRRVSTWPHLYTMNMSRAWSEYLVSFANTHILSFPHVDGIFFDIVSENISWANTGDIDMNGDGTRDTPALADRLWLEGTRYLLQYAQQHLINNIVIINGSSHPELQPYVHGRMFETFPTPWEGDGAWGTVMTNANTNIQKNTAPTFVIFNSNTNNTGIQTYKDVRFGLTSSLLLDNTYFSYDFGDQNHGQTWRYDEYDIDLGEPIADSAPANGSVHYEPDVWRRDFEHGVSLVNSDTVARAVPLGGDFEHIRGTQDPTTNNGSIVSEISLAGADGRILLKTFDTLKDIMFENGDFVRFLRPDGSRVRNGFFVFEEGRDGGDGIAHIDLNGDGLRELFVVDGNKILAWRHDGQPYINRLYPYTANYTGTLRVMIGDINNDARMEIYVAPEPGYPAPIKVYTRYGYPLRQDWYPFGEEYSGGYTLALGGFEKGSTKNIILGSGTGVEPRVGIYTWEYQFFNSWLAFEKTFKGGINVASGDLDGDGIDEVIVGAGPGKPPVIRTFDKDGVQLYDEFQAYSSFSNPGIRVRTQDVDFDGKDDILGFSSGF